MERRLAAILATDVVGYSRLMGEDEAGTLAALRAHRRELIDPAIAVHGGHVVKTTGDGMLIEFSSVVEAVQCAVEFQRAMVERNADLVVDRRIIFRVGINIGDVIVEDGDIFGDGVNVAARLEALAQPGSICISAKVHDEVRDRLDLSYQDLGDQELKNIAQPIRVFQVVTEPGAVATAVERRNARPWPAMAAAATMVIAVLGGIAWWQPWTREVDRAPLQRAANLPAIAVLPFDNMSGDPSQDYFSDGVTEDLINDLSRVSGLLVIARNTMFTYKGTAVNVRDVGRELGVQYVLEGSVRKADNRIRINAQLIDAENEHHLWAARYERELTDVFALQDEVAQKIVSALAVQLTPNEREQLSHSVSVHPEAYDTLLRGLERYRRYTRETNLEARQLFQKVIELEPGYARAYADLALTYYIDLTFGWTPPEAAIVAANKYALRALELDNSLPQVHFALSDINRIQGRHDAAIAAARRSIVLDPNYADGYAVLGLSLMYAGRLEEAVEAMQRGMELNPRHPFFYLQNLGHAYFLMGRYEEAITAFQQVLEKNPHFLGAHLLLAASYGQLDSIEDAEWEAAEVLTLEPNFSWRAERERSQYKNPADLERLIEGMRKAGLPE